MADDIKFVKDKNGNYIPKYFRDFKELVKRDVELSESVSMNYAELDTEDLGASLEQLSQSLDWIYDLIENRHLIYQPLTPKTKKDKKD
ncbi:hypothetical protein J2T50_001378 [Streptococcus gallinaceus]|uniref:hypothetical protein n=1 Tax=Streptococcus gallinaceus TaxID=165758 RepID=UPI00209FFA98|nr:hypothetical protein [Streptococcus gallinaceus]MCP1639669.1 hypothetical protein [Streptococcus gallinaceus]MCP1770452.1 hypothetical protein [Streptococcus gallinaceus]